MKSIVYNMGYFLKEAKTLFKIDLTSNILSILSIGLIFFYTGPGYFRLGYNELYSRDSGKGSRNKCLL